MSKHKDLSVRQKQEMLKRYDDTPKYSQREALSKLGISQSTLFNLLKQKDAIFNEIKKNGNISYKGKHDGKAEDIEYALLNWFKSVTIQKISISCSIFYVKKHSSSLVSFERKISHLG